MSNLTSIPKLAILGTATVLALAVAGCGGATQTPTGGKATPKPGASAKATPSTTTTTTAPINCNALPATTVTVAQGASNSYTFNIPSEAMPKGAPGAYAGNTGNGDKGSPVWIASNWQSYIPHIPVVNDTNGAVSNCTAEEWGYGLLKMIALDDWASTYDAPQLEQSTAAPSGSAPYFYGGSNTIGALIAGDRQVATGGIWPTKLILVPLNTAAQQDQQTTSKFAFVEVTPGSDTQTVVTTTQSGQSSKASSNYAPNGGGLLIAGVYETHYINAMSVATTWPFGPVFSPTSFQMCSADGVTSAICGSAGVS